MFAHVRGGAQETAQCEELQLPVTLRGGDRRSGGGSGGQGAGPALGQEVPPLTRQSALTQAPTGIPTHP